MAINQPGRRSGQDSESARAETAAGESRSLPSAKAGTAKEDKTKATPAKAGATKAAPSKAGATRATAARPGPVKAGGRPPGNRPSGGRPGNRPAARPKSIVTQKRRPWGLIVATIAIVAFTAAVIGYAIAQSGGKSDGADPYTRNQIAAVKDIKGATYRKERDHTHVPKAVSYDSSPPVGGNHAQYWADCTGTVYPNAIANENAVHSLEHGAVWVAYRPGLSAADVKTLSALVTGQDRLLMSPYPGLDTAVSLQAWGYQLKVGSASDPRIKQFIDALRFNPATTPEPSASCSNPAFKTSPSTPQTPLF